MCFDWYLIMKINDLCVSNDSNLNGNQIYNSAHDKIAELVKKRLFDVSEELNRLLSNKVIRQSIQTITSKGLQLTEGQKVAIAQTLELKICLEDTHYVLNHGQSMENFLLHITTKKVKELFESKKYTYFSPLRHEIFLEESSKDRDTLWYRKVLETGTWDAAYSAELLSCDINPESTEDCESALFFFKDNSNMACHSLETLISKVVKNYIHDDVISAKIANEILDLAKDASGGVLQSICIPKDKFSDIGYVSNAGGSAVFPFCNLHNMFILFMQEGHPVFNVIDWMDSWLDYFQITSRLDGLQLNAQKSEMDKQRKRGNEDSMQVRLLANKIIPENNIFVLSHSADSTSGELLRIENAIEKILLRNMQQVS